MMAQTDPPPSIRDLGWGLEYTHLLRTRAYLSSLPRSLSSYPACCVKGGVWRNIVAGTDMATLMPKVPDELGVLPNPNILASTWFPATQHFASHLAMRDCLFSSDDAIYQHFRELNRKLLSGPLYRVMFAVASPRMVAQAAGHRFGALFRGIELQTIHGEGNCIDVSLTYPKLLVPRLVAVLFMTAFEAALEMAGAQDISGRMREFGDTAAIYRMVWR